MFINTKKTSGFTLMETVVALSLGMILTAMIVFVFTAGLKNIRKIKNIQTLNSSASFFLDTATYRIKRGEIFDATTPGELKFISPTLDPINKSFFINNGADEATTTFTEFQKSIRLNFIIQKGSETFSATTTIAKRAF